MAIFDGSVAVEIIDFLKQTIFCTVGNNSFEMEGQSATSRQSATSMMQINMTYGTDCQPTLDNILFRLSVFDLRNESSSFGIRICSKYCYTHITSSMTRSFFFRR
mmetsp:Transcript_16529/g.19074  ORF Transcript_16529/g.19074 Transcript_16529/m.19074 type:complete len:105 (-) Transcript_16529:1214-1528(-)